MFCLDRQRGGSEECPTETLKTAGSTGNVYTVRINKLPSCDCPHAVCTQGEMTFNMLMQCLDQR
jgi:hypothetical protein